jgi:hypothetical protein
MLLSTPVDSSLAIALWFSGAWLTVLSLLAHDLSKLEARLTSSDTGPDDGVASPGLFVGVPLLHSLILNCVARSGARGVRCH